ncbi:MAG: pyrroline-5-carboxylate reductase [Anaerolineaceae bacterium]|nr:pyrroline-5-carboxylate reductase [Anaerolineaceae bacterium]
MNEKPVIVVVGPGAMGEAIIAGLLREKLTDADKLLAAGPIVERGEELQKRYGIQPYYDNVSAVKQADVVILSIKPQNLDSVMTEIGSHVPAHALVLSIVAGATIEMITQGLEHECVVRAMPNTPAQIGQGIAAWTASPQVSKAQREQARSILQALGEELYMKEERYLDMATALSGSGPAYAFLFMESMIDAGVHMGFQRRDAEKLVIQTLRGSVEYYASKNAHPATLRNEVTSPAGTSAEAIYYLEKAGFRTAISRAIWAAFKRSRSLGAGKKSQPPADKD